MKQKKISLLLIVLFFFISCNKTQLKREQKQTQSSMDIKNFDFEHFKSKFKPLKIEELSNQWSFLNDYLIATEIRITNLYLGGVDSPFWDTIDLKVQREKLVLAEDAAKAIKQAADDQAEAMRRAGLSAEELAKEQKTADKNKRKDEADAASKNLRFAQSSSAKLWESMGQTGGSAEVLKNKFFDLAGDSKGLQVGLRLFSAGLEGATAATKTYATGLL